MDFVRVPNLTLMVDKEYYTNGLVQKAMEVTDDYIKQLDIKGIERHVIHPEGKSPMVIYIVPPSEGVTKNVMLYGHLDKQPYGTGWHEGISPTEPVIKGDCLYGRGASDDGYAPFICALAIKCIQEQGGKLPRIALVLETEEESGSPNLLSLLEIAEPIIQKPDVCFCMDSGALDYESLWTTSSLRGICIIDLTVEAAKIGYHSGATGGIVPETFRIVREILNRLDDPKTGKVNERLQPEVPEWKYAEAKHVAKI